MSIFYRYDDGGYLDSPQSSASHAMSMWMIIAGATAYYFRDNIKNFYHSVVGEPAAAASLRAVSAAQAESPPARAPDGRPYAIASCPICLNACDAGVETNCGHKFCFACFSQYHANGPAHNVQPVSCPLCRRAVDMISEVLPEGADGSRLTPQQTELMKQYNRRFSNEPRSLMDVGQDAPYYLRRLWAMVKGNPARTVRIFCRLRVLLGFFSVALYMLSPFDIIPEAVLGVFGLADDFIIFGIFVVYVTTIFRAFLHEEQ